MTGIMTAFLGGVRPVVNFVNQSISGVNPVGVGPATAGYQIKTDGFDYKTENSTTTVLTQWITPILGTSDYEVYATPTGTTPSGTVNSWVSISTNPSWSLVAGGPSSSYKTCSLAMQVRVIGSTTVIDTWTVGLEADHA
jgi:hypothetical protein